MTFTGLLQIVSALAGAGLTAAACYALGAILLNRVATHREGSDASAASTWGGAMRGLHRYERIPLAFVVGAACLHLIVFLILILQLGYWPLLTAVLLAAIGAAWKTGSWRPTGPAAGLDAQALDRSLRILLGLAGGAFFVVYFIYALAPEHSPDGATYHLGFVARYLRDRGFEPVYTNLYAMLGQGMEMLFVPAFAIGRHPAAALVQLCFSVATAWMILNFGRRLGRPWAGGAAAMLTFLSPVFGRTSSIAYVDTGTAAVVFGAFYFLELWREQRRNALLIPAGLLCGYAYASKYTAGAIGLYAVLLVAYTLWNDRREPRGTAALLRPLLLLTGCAVVMAGPWILKDAILYDNPIAPLGTAFFPNHYIHRSFEITYAEGLSRYGVENKWELPIEVTFRGEKTQGIIGPIFLLLPLALFGLRSAALGGVIGRLLLAAIPVFLPYFANVGTRFLIPSLPFFSLAIALTLARHRALLTALIIVHAILSWPITMPLFAGKYAWRIDEIPYRAAFRITPPDEYLSQRSEAYQAAKMLDGWVPPGKPVFGVNGAADAYTRVEVMVSFQAAENEIISDLFNMGWIEGNQPMRLHHFEFPERPVRRLRIVQTGDPGFPQQWDLHEINLSHGGEPLQRGPDWRIKSSVNPWDVQFAFDGSPVTRWRSWQAPEPGDYIEVDLGSEQPLDQVDLLVSHESPGVAERIEVQTANGEWVNVDDQLEEVEIDPPPSLRRDITYAMHTRGVDYLLLRDTDFGAVDVLDDPEAWGLVEIASIGETHLFHSIFDEQSAGERRRFVVSRFPLRGRTVTDRYFLGIDGGQSSTIAMIGNASGRVIGTGVAGPCNHVGASERRAKFFSAVGESVRQAVRQAAIPTDTRFAAVCAGFSGGSEDKDALTRELIPADAYRITHDAHIALTGATAGGPGIIVIAGTGSIVYGRNADGKIARAGGWGYLFGDGGGAFDLVRQALRAVLQHHEGWGPETSLTSALLDATGTNDPNQLLHAFYIDAWPRERIATLAPSVCEAATGGDPVAREILKRAAQDLMRLVNAVRAQLFPDHAPVSVHPIGGVFQCPHLKSTFASLAPSGVTIAPPRHDPARGALLEAYRLAGLRPELR